MTMTEGLTPKTAGAGTPAAVRKGPVGQPARAASGLPQQDRDRRRGTARGRGRDLGPQGRRVGLSRRSHGIAALPRTLLPPCRDRIVKFALPPIESAPTGQSRWAEGPRHRGRDERGYLGTCRRGDYAGRGGDDRGGVGG